MDDNRLASALTEIRPELVRYVTRLTGSPDSAEDVAQTVFMRAFEAFAHEGTWGVVVLVGMFAISEVLWWVAEGGKW